MVKFKDRYNLFSGKLRVAPRPLVPTHWDVPEDHPSATRFWVNPQSGATSTRPEADGWTFSEALRQWHQRQSGRVWASRRLVQRRGVEEAQRRVKDLQMEVNGNIRTANAYVDLLISIDYEACRLTQRAERAEQQLVDTTRRVREVASFLGRTAEQLDLANAEAIRRARVAAGALDDLVDALKQTSSPVDRRFDPPPVAAVDGERVRHDVCEWVRYATPNRKYRRPDLNWLLAAAVVTYLDNKQDVSVDIACQRVSGYLTLLDAPFGAAGVTGH